MTVQEARDDEREALIAEAQEYLDIECNMSRYPILVDKLLTALRDALQELARKHPEPEITDEMVERARDAAKAFLRTTEPGTMWRPALEAALRVTVGESDVPR